MLELRLLGVYHRGIVMVAFDGAAILADTFLYSNQLKRNLSALTDTAFVQIDAGGFSLPLQTQADGIAQNHELFRRRALRVSVTVGAVVAFGPYEEVGYCPLNLPEQCLGSSWRIFAFRFENGSEDHIALCLKGGDFDEQCDSVLSAIWPVLREDCVREVLSSEKGAALGALTWVATKKSDAAVIVVDGHGHILETNESGRDLLNSGAVLIESSGVLCCANPTETKALRQGLQECLTGGKGAKPGAELIMFLGHRHRSARVPVALSRYDHPDHAEPLVVALIPRQPDRKRIEMLAQKLGLTPAEARVAALIQLGLPNREAAHIAGIKEQTFNTYAKRVLSKLGVNCRAEMVNMLTWQGALGRAS